MTGQGLFHGGSIRLRSYNSMDQGQMVAKIAHEGMLSTTLPEFGLSEHNVAFANI